MRESAACTKSIGFNYSMLLLPRIPVTQYLGTFSVLVTPLRKDKKQTVSREQQLQQAANCHVAAAQQDCTLAQDVPNAHEVKRPVLHQHHESP